MFEIIIDEFEDFIDSRDYKEDGRSTSIITNLEKYILVLLKDRKEITIKFTKETKW